MPFLRKDILLDAGDDLLIKNGDLAVGESDRQHLEHLVYSSPGDFKQYPPIGANVREVLKSRGGQVEAQNRITKNLGIDGYRLKGIKINGEDISINAEASN